MKTQIIFDVDGVLVDVSESYRVAISRTVEYFSGASVDNTLINMYKFTGGFNNDWELTAAILRARSCIVPYDEVVDKFQETYLGDNFNGVIKNEKPFIESTLLDSFVNSGVECSVVTGRPSDEAEFALNRFGLREYLTQVITMNDVGEKRGKPEPDGINMVLTDSEEVRAFYVGDTVDDMVAALRAGIEPIGAVWAFKDSGKAEKELADAGATAVIKTPGELWRVIE